MSINNKQTIARSEPKFYSFIAVSTIAIVALYFAGVPTHYISWFSFFLAALSVAGNDAIQTIGTFIESKKDTPLLPKIIVFCGLLYLVHLYAWYSDGGQIHFDRLKKIEYNPEYNLIQLIAPIILLIITRLKAPISTTFLILSLFSTKTDVIAGMLSKSLIGYGVSFVSAFILWGVLAKFSPKEYEEEHEPDPKSEKIWSFLQWISTASLWVSWMLQDTANIAVYIPRQLSFIEFFVGMTIMAGALVYILADNGGRIQEIVNEKSDINTAKAATIIDFIYAIILFVFKTISNLPMSTTWVFLGLLAGREIILHIVTTKDLPYMETFRKVGKDIFLATVGIIVSLAIYYVGLIFYPVKKKATIRFEAPHKIEVSYQKLHI